MIAFGLVLIVPTLTMLEKMPIIVVSIFGVGISFLVTFGGIGLVDSLKNLRDANMNPYLYTFIAFLSFLAGVVLICFMGAHNEEYGLIFKSIVALICAGLITFGLPGMFGFGNKTRKDK